MEDFYLILVSMGYGHQRTGFPLKKFAFQTLNANDYEGIPKRDKEIWKSTKSFYETISRMKNFPLLGNFLFWAFDRLQKIPQFYPKRDLSQPTLSLKTTYSLFKKNWMRHLFQKLSQKPLPVISTFFTPAFALEFFGYQEEIFLVVCDADVSRSWAPLFPQKSKIKYFVPTKEVKERLKMYGVKEENIFFTGYPLPLESEEDLKAALKVRLLNLDPFKNYFSKYQKIIENTLGPLPPASFRPLTLLFSVGGAGAQKEIGFQILRSLREKILQQKIKIVLSCGIRQEVKNYFLEAIEKLNLASCLNKSLEILFEESVDDYFEKFNQTLKNVDILWTKPSELSFYSALGIPIIVAPPIGSQEEFNLNYLVKSGFGIFQENPKYTHQWLFDWLEKGYLAECAMEGFLEGERNGTEKILKIVSRS